MTLLNSDSRLHFDEGKHRYAFSGKWLQHSVTQAISDLTQEAKAQIEATKHGPDGWEARGNAVHKAGEEFLLFKAGVRKEGLVYDERWEPWVSALVEHWLWEDCIVEAVELRLCDPRKSLGGSLDFIVSDKNGDVILGDIKSVRTLKAVDARKPATAQLGAYAAMVNDSHKLWIDKCCTLVIGPGRARLITEKPDDCLAAWLDAWMNFDARTPDI